MGVTYWGRHVGSLNRRAIKKEKKKGLARDVFYSVASTHAGLVYYVTDTDYS